MSFANLINEQTSKQQTSHQTSKQTNQNLAIHQTKQIISQFQMTHNVNDIILWVKESLKVKSGYIQIELSNSWWLFKMTSWKEIEEKKKFKIVNITFTFHKKKKCFLLWQMTKWERKSYNHFNFDGLRSAYVKTLALNYILCVKLIATHLFGCQKVQVSVCFYVFCFLFVRLLRSFFLNLGNFVKLKGQFLCKINDNQVPTYYLENVLAM